MALTLKKSLGQHFLIDTEICQKIVDAVYVKQPSILLEIGPGGGAITKYFVQNKELDFWAVEIDLEKVAFLQKKFPTLKEKIIAKSILAIDCPFENKFTIVGNFPYNISTEILFKIMDWKEQVEAVVGMFQKEVAVRVAAQPGNKMYGVTSVLLQTFFAIEYLFDVPPESFKPPPNVMSGVIKLTPLNNIVPYKSYEKLSLLVKTAFNQRRKTLRNAVKGIFTTEVLADAIFDKRAEQLSVEDFANLTFKMP
jgi:16S rRNA (adenine1518-N6/adenine1519-N6)-dimethyltransferase